MARKRGNPILKLLLVIFLAPYALAIAYWVVPPPSTLMIARAVTLQPMHRNWVPLERISPALIAAVVTSEDSAFCRHYGFDFKQLEKAIEKAANGKAGPGASTISMQTAKNLFLWNGRSWLRKALEAPLTLWLELIWSKKRILEVYLNIAEWGEGIFGAEAAAKHYFGTSAKNLTQTQAALLAAALPNPIKRSAANPGVGQMLTAGGIERKLRNARPDLSCVSRNP